MKRIIRLFTGYYHLQVLFAVAQELDERDMAFATSTDLLIEWKTGNPLPPFDRIEASHAPIDGVDAVSSDESDKEFSVRDELALIAHLMRGRKYSSDELGMLEERAKLIVDTLSRLGLDITEDFVKPSEAPPLGKYQIN